MTRIERMRTVMNGGIPDRIPVITHNFLMAAREAGVTMSQFRSDGQVMANAMIEACKRYDTDGIFLDVDTALLASACGADVVYPADIAAVCRDEQPRSIEQLIDELAEVDLLGSDRIKIYLDAIDKLSVWCNENDVFLRANADQGPFSLACLLVGMNEFLVTLLDDDETDDLLLLMEQTLRISTQMHELCFRAGGHGTSYGNSSSGCSVVSPSIFRTFAKPFEIRLNQILREKGIPTLCHICGWVDPILEDLKDTGCPMYEFDSRTDIRKAMEIGCGHYALSGNLDPAMLGNADPETVRAETKSLLDLFRGKGGLILASGCALGPNTPSENIHAMVETAKMFG